MLSNHRQGQLLTPIGSPHAVILLLCSRFACEDPIGSPRAVILLLLSRFAWGPLFTVLRTYLLFPLTLRPGAGSERAY